MSKELEEVKYILRRSIVNVVLSLRRKDAIGMTHVLEITESNPSGILLDPELNNQANSIAFCHVYYSLL